ncbi:phospholipase D/nuclease [Gonapodya prolifera JEL478]|uniref:CDP-diacylglycerol--glycerol-3-phosphate 3-phosphatidyltransferase n=1 Tax=Gonapodya prolifera (strain JEL478) TaxID=1344416 RepID=A0A139AZM2_GONPJ|nr:phospholipase D/nuclease [Gonapodya prolifera JEL478]|eukprot:KXS22154.1 phospholipase D/nuclease [Gonapodya prolifera JEL478]
MRRLLRSLHAHAHAHAPSASLVRSMSLSALSLSVAAASSHSSSSPLAAQSSNSLTPPLSPPSTPPQPPQSLPNSPSPKTPTREFDSLVGDLAHLAPVFYLHGNNIEVMYSPNDFYSTLKQGIANAKRRIVLASLYIGHEEHELVSVLALSTRPQLHITILIDHLRSTRPAPNPLTLLQPLLDSFPDRCVVATYRTPEASGWKARVGKRFVEGWGVMHGKVYVWDDVVMLGGANLSHDYFTTRQDRAILFRDAPLADHFASLVDTLTGWSYRLLQSINTSSSSLPTTLVTETHQRGVELAFRPPPVDPATNPRAFRAEAGAALAAFLERARESHSALGGPGGATPTEDSSVPDTAVIPTFQAGPLGQRQDEAVVRRVVGMMARGGGWKWFASGYFNVESGVWRDVVGGRGGWEVLTAAPEANGFYQSRGISRFIPHAYTHLERVAFEKARRAGQNGVRIWEWKRGGWTYHAKGLWLSPPKDPSHPFMTVIGSTNFGKRSFTRDVETNAVVVTTNRPLREQMAEEVRRLWKDAEPVGEETFRRHDRRVPVWVKLVTWMFSSSF